jgi:hypothetical protein
MIGDITIKKYKSGRIWCYEITLHPLGFNIILSKNQLQKIEREGRGRIYVDFEKIEEQDLK